jgi:serine/threonine-protein kinase RIO1
MLLDNEAIMKRTTATPSLHIKHGLIDESPVSPVDSFPIRKRRGSNSLHLSTSIQPNSIGVPLNLCKEPTLECLYGRIRYNSSQKAILLNFDGLYISTLQHVKNVRQAIANILASHSKSTHKVACLVNYDNCTVDDNIRDLYDTEVDQYLSEKYYKSVQRFTSKSFLQDQLARRKSPIGTEDTSSERIITNRYLVKRPLGEGTYGVVWLAMDQQTKNHVAIKEYKKSSLREMPELATFVEREISILRKVKGGHANVVSLLDYIENEDSHFLVMEFCQLGCLDSPYNPHQQFAEAIAHRYFVQMAEALRFLHQEHRVVHRDLQLSNVCVDINDNIKIVDFGVSDFFDEDKTMNILCGNSLYASPEMLLGKPYVGPEADVWSLGCCLYKMLIGYHPFRSAQKVLVRDFMIPLEEEEELSDDVKDLINHILCLDKKRYTLEDIRAHPWFRNGSHS